MKRHCHSMTFRIVAYLKPYIREFSIAGILTLVSVIIGFLQPLVIQQITDSGMLEKDLSILFRAVLVLALLVTLNQIIEIVQAKLFVKVHIRSYYTVFQQVYHKLLHLKKSYFEDKNNTEILSFLQMDTSQVASITDRYTIMSISNVFRIISGLVGLLIISWKLTLIVLAMVPIKILLVNKLSKRREKAMNMLIECSRDFSRWFGDSLNGIDEIKLWNLFESRNKIFQSKQKEILGIEKDNSMIDAWNTLWESLLEWSITIMLYLVGGMLICKDTLTIGAVFAFTSYSWYVTGPVSSLLNLKMYFSQIKPSAKRLFQFLDMESEQDNGFKRVENFPPRIEFKDVSFSYQENRQILNKLSFFVAPGEKVAIIGQNGSGKSTLMSLLLRFYDPDSGMISADDINISALPLDEYRSLFSVVSQEPYLFLGDILGNINLNGTADQRAINKAIQISGVSDLLQRMPDGANTQIGRNGARLSGGEKQKLAVARAILKDSPIIILDEATSSYDVESDVYLHDMIVNHMKGKSIILITHHYTDLSGMDRVYRIEKGKAYEVDPRNLKDKS